MYMSSSSTLTTRKSHLPRPHQLLPVIGISVTQPTIVEPVLAYVHGINVSRHCIPHVSSWDVAIERATDTLLRALRTTVDGGAATERDA